MPRRVRVFVAGGISHICCRVVRGEFVFNEPGEADRWVDLVAYVARLFDLEILAWSLLAPHPPSHEGTEAPERFDHQSATRGTRSEAGEG